VSQDGFEESVRSCTFLANCVRIHAPRNGSAGRSAAVAVFRDGDLATALTNRRFICARSDLSVINTLARRVRLIPTLTRRKRERERERERERDSEAALRQKDPPGSFLLTVYAILSESESRSLGRRVYCATFFQPETLRWGFT